MLPVWLWPSCPCTTTLLPWSLLCLAFDGCTLSKFCNCHHYGWWQLPSILELPWVGVSCWFGVSRSRHCCCCLHCSHQAQTTFFKETTPILTACCHMIDAAFILAKSSNGCSSRQQVCSSKPVFNGICIDAWSGDVIATRYTVPGNIVVEQKVQQRL